MRLLGTCAGIDRLVPEGSTPPPFDVQAPLLSLPRIFRTTLATIPANIPYLRPDPELLADWQRQLSGVGSFKVGIAWQGNPDHQLDRRRSVPLLAFAPLADVPGVSLVSLQKGPGREQLPDLADRMGVLDLADRLEDFVDTAAVISNLDLVITVDTALAHLAGPWEFRCGWRCRWSPTGDGCWSERTAPGIPACACSARKTVATGPMSSSF